jgi:putative transposase
MEQVEAIRRRLIARVQSASHEDLVAVDNFLARRAVHNGAPVLEKKDWPHAPPHRISSHGTFLVTGGTLHKRHFFRSEARLNLLEDKLLELAKDFGWQLEAWAVFSNHYHFVGHCQASSAKLKDFSGELHAATAAKLNQEDGEPKRKVWHNYFETALTFQPSYFARLNYVHQNAVKHGLVPVANQYRWCSAAWFERTASRAQVKTVYSFKIDKLKVLDDYDV